MPYLVRIGVIKQNKKRTGARGYAVFRNGRKVTVWYGKVEALGGGTTKFYWRREPTLKAHPMCKSVSLARALAKQLVAQQLKPGVKGGYSKLPAGVRIRSHTRKPRPA